MQLIDTHVHLTYADYTETQDSVAGVIGRAKASGVTRFVVPGLDALTSKQAIALSEQYADVIPAIGLHPSAPEENLEQFRELAANPVVKAIGEIGTDAKAGDWAAQEQRIRFFLELAIETNKPAIIHIRDTWDDTFAILRDYPELQNKAVIHCFAGGHKESEQIAKLGLLISVTAILARKNTSPETLEVVKAWPVEKMMLETDGPYLAWPGESWPNEPSTVRKVAEFIAELKGEPLETIAEKTTATATSFFGL